MEFTIEKYKRKINYEGNAPTLEFAVPANDRSALEARRAECERLMSPLVANERAPLAFALSRMFAGFENGRPVDVEVTVATYIRALGDLPFCVIEQAISDIECGRVEGLSPDFRPTAARIYQIAETKLKKLRSEKAQIEIILNANVVSVSSPTREEDQHLASKMQAFAKDFSRKISRQPEEDQKRKEKQQRAAEHLHNQILAEYRANGLHPIYANGMPISLSLARTIGASLSPLSESAMNGGLGE